MLFAGFGIDADTTQLEMYRPEFGQALDAFAPAPKLVPVARLNGDLIFDTLAIAEELNQRHPDKGMWPSDPKARAFARSIVAEMHSGFTALRSACAMNLRISYPDFEPSEDVLKDTARIEMLWTHALDNFGQNGDWLFGEFSIADVFFAPVATRFATYHLPRQAKSDAYIKRHIENPLFRQWRARGLAEGVHQPVYDLKLPTAPWVGPKPLDAKATARTDSENKLCPYSGKDVTHFLELDGRIFGFCNAFCRDKTVADGQAWPAFMKLYET